MAEAVGLGSLRLELGLEVGDGFFEGVYGAFGQRLVAGDGFGDFRVAVSVERLAGTIGHACFCG